MKTPTSGRSPLSKNYLASITIPIHNHQLASLPYFKKLLTDPSYRQLQRNNSGLTYTQRHLKTHRQNTTSNNNNDLGILPKGYCIYQNGVLIAAHRQHPCIFIESSVLPSIRMPLETSDQQKPFVRSVLYIFADGCRCLATLNFSKLHMQKSTIEPFLDGWCIIYKPGQYLYCYHFQNNKLEGEQYSFINRQLTKSLYLNNKLVRIIQSQITVSKDPQQLNWEEFEASSYNNVPNHHQKSVRSARNTNEVYKGTSKNLLKYLRSVFSSEYNVKSQVNPVKGASQGYEKIGKLKISEKTYYYGQITSQQPNGYGFILTPCEVFSGYFKDGLLDGPGRIVFQNGDTCEGIFVNGECYFLSKFDSPNSNSTSYLFQNNPIKQRDYVQMIQRYQPPTEDSSNFAKFMQQTLISTLETIKNRQNMTSQASDEFLESQNRQESVKEELRHHKRPDSPVFEQSFEKQLDPKNSHRNPRSATHNAADKSPEPVPKQYAQPKPFQIQEYEEQSKEPVKKYTKTQPHRIQRTPVRPKDETLYPLPNRKQTNSNINGPETSRVNRNTTPRKSIFGNRNATTPNTARTPETERKRNRIFDGSSRSRSNNKNNTHRQLSPPPTNRIQIQYRPQTQHISAFNKKQDIEELRQQSWKQRLAETARAIIPQYTASNNTQLKSMASTMQRNRHRQQPFESIQIEEIGNREVTSQFSKNTPKFFNAKATSIPKLEGEKTFRKEREDSLRGGHLMDAFTPRQAKQDDGGLQDPSEDQQSRLERMMSKIKNKKIFQKSDSSRLNRTETYR